MLNLTNKQNFDGFKVQGTEAEVQYPCSTSDLIFHFNRNVIETSVVAWKIYAARGLTLTSGVNDQSAILKAFLLLNLINFSSFRENVACQNLMYDRRVVRGSNFASTTNIPVPVSCRKLLIVVHKL